MATKTKTKQWLSPQLKRLAEPERKAVIAVDKQVNAVYDELDEIGRRQHEALNGLKAELDKWVKTRQKEIEHMYDARKESLATQRKELLRIKRDILRKFNIEARKRDPDAHKLYLNKLEGELMVNYMIDGNNTHFGVVETVLDDKLAVKLDRALRNRFSEPKIKPGVAVIRFLDTSGVSVDHYDRIDWWHEADEADKELYARGLLRSSMHRGSLNCKRRNTERTKLKLVVVEA